MFSRFFTAVTVFCVFLTGDLLAQSTSSDIIANGSFIYPTNIPYELRQEASDIVSDANSVLVASFTLRDGGASNDGDALSTELTSITFDLGPNWQMIRLIELRTAADGAVTVTSILVSSQTVQFSAMTAPNSILAPDNGSINFGVRVSFMNTPATITDNARVTITVSAVTSAGSQFAAGNGGGATTSVAGTDNQIEVTATALSFSQGPNHVALGAAMTPAVVVQAVDGNGVRDLDNGSSIAITSTGTLTGTPVTVVATNGQATFSTLTHTVAQTGRTISAAATTPSLTTTGASSLFNVGGSDIILTPGFDPTDNIGYSTRQEAANIVNSGTSIVAGSFRIRDDVGAAGLDGSTTVMTGLTLDLGPNWSVIRRIALRNAADGADLGGTTNEQNVSGQTVIFSGLTGVTCADNGTLDFLVRVSFQDPITDNLQFSLTITNATSTGTPFAPSNAGSATTPVVGDDNRIEVTATKLLFVQGPTNVAANVAMAPSVTIESVDALDNRDLDNASNVLVTSTGTLTGSPVTVAAANGLATFPGLTHTVAQTGRTLSATSTAPILTTTGLSTTFNVTGTSDIQATGGFTYPTDIAYASFQETDITVASPVVAKFDVRDGSGSSDADALPTVLTNISFSLSNFADIRRMAIYDAAGTTELAEVAVSSGTVTFGGLTISAADNGSTSFTVLASFNDPVTDNHQFQLIVTSATAQAGNSQFAAANAGAAQSSTSGNDNKIEVTATKLAFVVQPSSVFTATNMTPAVTIEAVDALDNRDLDNSSSVAVTSTGTLTGTPVTVGASNGLATFASLQHSAAGTGLTLSATATSPALTAVGPSSTFNVSGGSDIIRDVTFDPTDNIAYASFQAANITSTADGVMIGRFIIRDGGGVNDPAANSTTMTNLSIDLGPNFAMFRRVALFNSTGATQMTGTSEVTVASQTVNFSSLGGTGTVATDFSTITFSVLATFVATAPAITDNTQFQITLTAGTATGSAFASPFLTSNTPIVGDDNRIEVSATKLLFGQGPSNVEANASMAPAVTIQSVDANNILDLDNASNVLVTSTGTLAGTPVTVAAVNGLATFSSLTHTVAQTGRTLSATSNTPVLTPTVPSATFNVTGTSDIIANTGFTYPSNIPYNTFQETNITVASPVVAKFDVQDGAGAADADALPTVLTDITFNLTGGFANLRRMAIYDAAGTTELAEVAVSSATVTFTGLTISAADGASTSFTVLASFNDPVTDNAQFQLTVTSAAAQPGSSQFTATNAGGALTSVASDDNRIEVTATKLLFVQQPSNVFTATDMAPAVTIEAVDALDNRDLDNGSTVAVTSTGTLTGSPVTLAASSGFATFSTLKHSVAGTGLTLSATASAPALTASGPSSTFYVAGGSDIISDGTFVYTQNIDYQSGANQNASITAANGTTIAKFVIRDGSGVIDPDGTGTQLTDITIDFGPNWAMLKEAELWRSDLSAIITGGDEKTVAGQTVTWNAISSTGTLAGDGGSTTFIVRVSFQQLVTDNAQVSATISAATATGSTFQALNAGGATTSLASDDNRIEVIADRLVFDQGPSNTFVNVAMSPAVTIEAVNPFNIIDLDNASSVAVTSTGVLTGTPVTVTAVNGLATFSTLTHSTVVNNKVLAATATSPTLTASGNSSQFDVVLAGSDIIANAGFVYQADIAYDTYQEGGNIVNSTTSLVVAKYDLRDGSGTTDADALGTTLTTLSLDLGPNFGLIRRIALFDAGGTTQLTGVSEVAVATQTVAFSGLTLLANDGANISFTVRASFQDPVTDNLQFSITVSAATATGSTFSTANAGGATTSVAGNNNRIEVLATNLQFVQGPSNTFINTSMAPSVTIQAVDNLDNRDLDNVSNVFVTSSGTLLGTPVSVAAINGLATFPSLTHSVAGTALTLAATSTVPVLTPTGNSTTFNILGPSNTSDIIVNAGFTHPSNIAYETFQEAANIVNSATSVVAAKFDIRDGGAGPDGDPFPTLMTNLQLDLGANWTFIRRIALYDATGTTELTGVNEQAVGSQFPGFSGLSLSAADNGTTSFTIRVSFTNAVVDNQQFKFTINSTATTANNSAFAAINAGAAVSSTTADDNRIEVTATKMRFVQNPTSTFVNLNMAPAVTVEAVDPLNNRDLDNTSSVDITSTGSLAGSPVNSTVTLGTGLATFASLQHTAAGVGLTLSATSTAPVLTTTGPSTTFGISDGSDIAADPGYVYNTNIPYDQFQESVNILNNAQSVVVARFFLRDGGAAPVDPDISTTQLTNLSLDLGPNFNLIRRIALYNAAGTVELPGLNEQAVGGQIVNFNALSIIAPDDAQTAFTVRVSFNAPVVDNLQFSFTVTSATAFAVGSQFAQSDAGGATTSLAGDDNRIEVTATRMAFVQQPTNTFINVGMTPAVTAETVDTFGSRDLDYGANVSITSSGTLTGSPVTVAAVNGFATFPGLAHSVAQIGRNLTAGSGGLTSALSNAFNVLPPSNQSDIFTNAAFTYQTNIAYNTFQENVNIVNSATSLQVAKFDLRDGGGAADADAFPTVLTNLTLDLGPNFGLIRRIALYDAAGTTELTGVSEQAVAAQLVAFSGLTLSATDGGSTTFTVRVSFQDPVTDNLQFSFTVSSAATQAINSSFALATAGAATTSVTGNDNRIEVTATKLLFVQGPTNAFINVSMTPAVTVEAVDPLDNRDLDYITNVSVTSTGTLTGTPVIVAPVSGLATFSTLAHSVAQVGRTIAATSGALTTTGASSTFNILAPTALSNIILDGTFVTPANIAYNTFQENTNIVSSTTSLVVGRFIVQDGGGASDADAFPTVMTNLTLDLGPNFALINRIALYDAAGTTELTGVSEQVVGAQTVAFSGLNISAPDNGNTTFTVRVSFKSAVTDNLQFSVLISNTTTVAINSSFAAANAGGAVTSTAVDNNRIEVTATLLRFTTNFSSPLLAAKDIAPVQQPSAPVIRAEDVLTNVDLDYATIGTITCALPVSPSVLITPTAGVFTFPNNFQFSQTGNGTITFNAPSLTGVISNPVVVNAGAATTITAGAGVEPGTISSLINTAGTAVPVFDFMVNDDPGGTAANNDDGLPTLISQIVLTQNGTNNTISDWTQVINSAQLSDGTNTLSATAITATSITFGGISTVQGPPAGLGFIGDNLSKTYTLRISIKAALGALASTIDGNKFEFQVLKNDVTLATSGSTTIIVGESETSGNANAVAVVVTALRFTSPTGPPAGITVSLDTDFPGVSVEAVDANFNRDRDYVAPITTVTNVSGVSTNPLSFTGLPFVTGVYAFPSTFRFTSGSSGNTVTLTLNTAGFSASSIPLTLLSSSESSIVNDPTFVYNPQLQYVQHQAADIDINNVPTADDGIEIARMLLIDGNRSFFNYGGSLVNTGTISDGTTDGDDDGADTRLNSITIRLTNPSTIRRVAIYSGSIELGEINVAALAVSVPIPDNTPFYDFTFSGAPLLVAPDNNIVTANGIVPISVRVSFMSSASVVTDGDLINVSVVGASLGTGSTFFAANGGGGSGIGTYQSPTPGFNRLNVSATSLDFVQQPGATAGVNELVSPAAIVNARDVFGVVDTDFNIVPSTTLVSSQGAATVLGSFGFSSGVMNMNGLITYGGAGIGTLKVVAGGLNSTLGAIPCTRVDVIHVTTTPQDGGANGVPAGASVSVLAGTQSVVLFGFGFTAPHNFAGNPKVTKFTVTFSNSVSGILSNFQVFESLTGVYLGSPAVSSANISPASPTTSLTVDFTASPKDLAANPLLSYFIVADVASTVGGATPTIKVSIIDNGVGSGSQNNILVLGNVGSQFSNTSGPTFNFASVAPPTLIDTYPRIGQTNVDPAQAKIEMSFSVPVFTSQVLGAQLWRKNSNPALADVFVADLDAANGYPFSPIGVGAGKPIIFNIPVALAADNEYYVTVPAGNLSTNQGILDQSRNLFPGISYPGTFFFRTGNTNAPQLLGSPVASSGDPNTTDITNHGATINATFDKLGKAYYIVSSTNVGAAPTNAEIMAGTWSGNTVLASGQIPINATYTQSQFGSFSVAAGFTPGTHYVWITAESKLEKKVGNVISTLSTINPAGSPYGSSNVIGYYPVVGGAITGPTLTFPAPGPIPTPNVTTNGATISICSNSYQILSTPIIIYEGTDVAQHQTFDNPTPDQTFNIVLPAGFQFDDAVDAANKPLYATVTLVGADFGANSQTTTFLSTSVLKITFTNTGTATLDKIIISNLRIKSDGSRSGNIFRLGGTGIPAINDGAFIARLSAQEAATIKFDNSYSISLGQTFGGTDFSETAIPDNAVPSLVTLQPYIQNAFDFGPTTFSGQGVNINTLNVNGVTKDVPFNITVSHTDQNGCLSDIPVQFVVYDNKRAVIIKNPKYDPTTLPTAGIPVNPLNVPISLDQGPYAAPIAIPINTSFRINEQIPSVGPGVVRDVPYDNLGAYYMETLVAAIPPNTPTTTIINSASPTYGAAWANMVAGLPQASGVPIIIGTVNYQNYKFDDQRIVNAHNNPGGSVIPYIYDYPDVSAAALPGTFAFKRDISASANLNYFGGITYYTGGSLGFVELTGTYHNIANPVVVIKRRQLVEFYLPAVPAIEFTTRASLIINGESGPGPIPIPKDLPLNPPSSTPLAPLPNNNNPGTLVYCEQSGVITVKGYPTPDLASGSTGTFKIYDAANYASNPLTATPLGGLNDFGTGTAQITPIPANAPVATHVQFADILIEYTFNDGNDSFNNLTPYTASTKATQIFRIVPNPTALFAMTSDPLTNPYVASTTAYCVGQPITFSPSGSSAGALSSGSQIQDYQWTFDDPSNALTNNPNTNVVGGPAGQLAIPGFPVGGNNELPIHTFSTAKLYAPSLVIVSNFGCKSPAASLPTVVGAIPVVNAIFDGTHAGLTVADQFHFQSDNSTVSGNDFFSTLQWTYGDRPTPTTPEPPLSFVLQSDYNDHIEPHNYTQTGPMVYDLKITSTIGCVNSLSQTNIAAGINTADNRLMRTLIVLPRFGVSASNAYQETFETPALGDVNAPLRIWQTWYTGAFQPATTPARSVDPTWVKGAPVGKFAPPFGTNIWTTSLAGTYSAVERSAIYSPSLDLSSLLRPMISFDTYTDLKGGDGVVLQFSTDNKNIVDPTKVWRVLGNTTDGENWYTDLGISAKPGDQVSSGDVGWSLEGPSWLSSRHALTYDSANTNPVISVLINKKRVIFRLALASASTSAPLVSENRGFGFDNVRIGERTRTILLETFSNTSNTTSSGPTTPGMTDEAYENAAIAGFNSTNVGLEVVKLNYHVNFPGNDPFNKTNPADPSSRALFYSISKTPAARLDGYAPAPYDPFSQWGQNTFSTRTLRLAQADIVIRPVTAGPASSITSSGKINFMVDISPTVDLDNKTILHVGIVEQNIPLASLADPSVVKTGELSFEYVVKKLLPSAAGTRTSTHPNATAGVLVAPIPQTPALPPITYTFGPFEWDPILSNFHAPSTGDLGVIAFLQRENGDREVYQAEIVLGLDDPPANLVTAIEPITADKVVVYPVPANHEMTVLMPGPVANQARLSLIDQTGREALTGSIPEGADRQTLNVRELSGGVYILTVDMGQGVLTRKKVMIVHQD